MESKPYVYTEEYRVSALARSDGSPNLIPISTRERQINACGQIIFSSPTSIPTYFIEGQRM